MLNRMTAPPPPRLMRLRLLLALAALLCAAGIAYAVMPADEAQAHDCGHVQFHQNHSGETGDHDSTLTFATDHGHNHQERAVIYTWYKGQSFGYGQPISGAQGWHLHCLIVGGV